MTTVTQSARLYLERRGIRPTLVGTLIVAPNYNPAHTLPVDPQQEDPVFTNIEEIFDPVDRGDSKPWPYG